MVWGIALTSAFAWDGAHANPPETDLASCMRKLEGQALKQGLNAATFERLTAGITLDPSVLALLDLQPEFKTPVWDYLAGLVDDERILEGRLQLLQWDVTLQAIAARFAVDPETIVALWGVESNFGQTFGARPLLDSLATLSCAGRRQTFFRKEFLTTLQILDQGHIAREDLKGSWAGAFGHTQFMPSTFMRIAVDFDGDGRRDLINSVPDALASTANYLARAGWRADEPWGLEVRLPEPADLTVSGRKNKQPRSFWANKGLTAVDGTPLPSGLPPSGLLLPAGPAGPAFLVMRNFDALFAYNASENYALAIAHLSDRLRGSPGFATPWPTNDPGLSRAQRRQVQTLLIERGYEISAVDGMIGALTRNAIKEIQEHAGLPIDGRAGKKLLAWLEANRLIR